MSKKSTKAKAPKATKADSIPKAKKKPEASDATPQDAEATTTEELATEGATAAAPEGGTTEVAAAAAPEAQTQSADFQIKKDAKGRFWVVAKDGGAEHGPYDTKKEATDAKAALASGAAPPEATTETRPAPTRKAKEPKEKKLREPGRQSEAGVRSAAATGSDRQDLQMEAGFRHLGRFTAQLPR